MSIQNLSGTIGRESSLPTSVESGPQVRQQTPAASQPAAATVAPEKIAAAVSQIKASLPVEMRNLQFSVDQETGRAVVSVVDQDTGTLIRQIPSEELVEIARSVGRMQGLLINHKA